ncbi:MAG: ABC transporter ATP-binding protein [Verrucomicrobiae bacterium]|nr:ABC transporter ATP-binding protein [Verrucomicrobiae bacterium]
MSSDHPIVLRGVAKHFPLHWRRGRVIAVEHLDLEVRRGEVFGLLGPNGSGKSTTLKMILGLTPPSSGEIELFGEPPARPETRRRLGFLPESPYFYRFLTGAETLRFFGRLCGVPRARLEARVEELIALVGLGHGRDRPLATYSKGMLQRIGLAQALVHDPELVLLDEPTAGVDPMGSRDIKDLILRLKSEGKTVVLSSHLLDQVEEVCDRVAILHLGRKIVEGPLGELLSPGDRATLEVEGYDERRADAIRAALASAGAGLRSVGRPRLTLEEIFVREVRRAGGDRP